MKLNIVLRQTFLKFRF